MGAVSLFGGLAVGGNWCQHEMRGGRWAGVAPRVKKKGGGGGGR